MKQLSVFLLLFFLSCVTTMAELFIIEDGKPNAEVVIAEKRPRMASLAALELQYYLQQITSARLPITTRLGDEHPVKIHVGVSAATKRLGVTADGLKYGAFRMVSGQNHLVLLDPTRIVKHQEDAWQQLRSEFSTFPPTVNLITGPSKTGDVEQTIEYGAHGPRHLHLLICNR